MGINMGKWTFLTILAVVCLGLQDAGAQAAKPMVGWRYIAENEEFWSKHTKDLQANAFEAAAQQALDLREKAANESEKNESNLALAEAFRGLGFHQAAFDLLLGIIEDFPGSFAANQALLDLAQMVPDGDFDEERLSLVINRSSPSELPPQAMSMVGFFLTLDHMKAGQIKWMSAFPSMIEPGSYWSARLDYLNALELVKAGQVDKAITAFEALTQHPAMMPGLLLNVRLQLARLHFERKDYPAAEKIYSGIRSSNRNTGRILYERAWNQYYLKDYSLALGMLESLRAPYFSPSLDPEQHLLRALILRDLCHYPEVRTISQDFNTVFGSVIESIRKVRPLKAQPVLMSMALVREPMRGFADVVDAIQKERKLFKEKFSSNRFAFVLSSYSKRENEIKGRLDRRLEQPLKFEANRLLELNDQLKLLDYVSGLDENRIQGLFESRGYKAEEADTLRFNTLYWPLRSPASENLKKQNRKEFWFDEMSNLRVLISDRCEKAGQ
jgi:tetratricopeptide (TPR) repeat protein